jgi:hypothetical protein
MSRTINWNILAAAAAAAGMSFFGVATSPAPTAAGQRTYGPYVSPDMVWIVAD